MKDGKISLNCTQPDIFRKCRVGGVWDPRLYSELMFKFQTRNISAFSLGNLSVQHHGRQFDFDDDSDDFIDIEQL